MMKFHSEDIFYLDADLAEMLSADMRKEDLCGRTLTLKLKTASFEVRTRAVTLQKYICSSEDILKHASKLLKAELPISLRLIGLRISQFNEDKNGTSSDPTQQTLSNFIISQDVNGRNMNDHHVSFGPDLSDDHSTTKQKSTGLPIDNHEICHNEFRDPLDSSEIPNPNNVTCILSYDNGEVEKRNGSVSNKSEAKFEGSSVDRVNRTNLSDDEAVSSSNQKELFFWVDDYKCLLCGFELPPSFVEERQEHSDFHLAERLQKEESNSDPISLTPKKRSIEKDPSTSQSRRKKKHKSPPTDVKHLRIDAFFVKK